MHFDLSTLQCLYFCKQVKNIIKRIQNCSDNMHSQERKELNSRYDAIRIQSLTHYLLFSTIYKHDQICLVRVKVSK